MQRRLLFLLFFLFAASPALEAQRPRVDVFRLDDGLPSTDLFDLEQAPDGRLWILTRAGLAIYDGRRFTPPAAGNAEADIGRLDITPQGRVWLTSALFGASLYRLDPDQTSWTRLPPVPLGLRAYDGQMSAFAATEQRAFVGSMRYGVLVWDGLSWTRLSEENSLVDPSVLALEAIDEDVWIGTAGGLCRLKQASTLDCEAARSDPRLSDPILAIAPDPAPERGIWLLSPSRLGRLDPQGNFHSVREGSDLPELELDRASLTIGPNGAFLLGNRFHAYLLDDVQNLRLDVRSGLPGGGVVKAIYGREGNLWLAGARGLAKIESLRFLTLDQSQGLSEDEVTALLELEPGRLLIGQNTSLAILQDDQIERIEIPLPELDVRVPRVLDLARSAEGVVWAAGADIGLVSFDPDRKPYRLKTRELDGAVFSVEADPDGVLWALTLEGLWRDRGDDLELISNPGRLVLRWLTFAPDGRPLIATRSGVLISEDGGVTWHAARGPTPQSEDVYRIERHMDGRFLAATGAGLSELRDGRLIPIDTGFTGPAYSVAIDQEQRIWFGTGDGVRVWDDENLRHFTVRHGLAGRETNRGAALVDHRGRVWIGTARGVSYFRERYDFPRDVPPGVQLDALLIGERTWPLDRPVRLDPDEHDFRIRLQTIAFARDEELKMRYRLEGLDSEWIETPVSDDTLRYTNVPAGDYTFRVAVGRGDQWSEEAISESIFVTRPIWREPFFQAAAAALLIGFVFAAHRIRLFALRRRAEELENFNRRLRQTVREKERAQSDRDRLIAELEQKNRELDQFARTVSHDLKAPLVTIRGFSGLARRDAARDRKERLAQDLDHIDDSIDKMHRLIDDLLELSRGGQFVHEPKPVLLAEVAREAVALLAGPIAEKGAIVTVSDELPIVSGDHIRLVQVFQNLIGNAVKFLEEGNDPRIEVSCESADHGVICCVRDRGPGIAPENLGKVFDLFERLGSKAPGTGVGLPLVKRIVEVHDGRIWVESDGLGRGAQFYFFLPTA